MKYFISLVCKVAPLCRRILGGPDNYPMRLLPCQQSKTCQRHRLPKKTQHSKTIYISLFLVPPVALFLAFKAFIVSRLSVCLRIIQ